MTTPDPATPAIRPAPGGARLDVRVVPRASREGLAGVRGGRLLVRVAAAPVDGAANDALIGLLAQALGLPRGALRVVAGAAARNKTVAVDGRAPEELARRLSDILP